MKEKDIHELIEQEESEMKERIWKRISSQLNLQKTVPQITNDKNDSVSNDCKDTGSENNKSD